MSRRIPKAAAFACLSALTCGSIHADSNINLVIVDGPGTGFNDPAPRAPVLGNAGTTLGEQRILAFEAALLFWEEKIDSDVDIDVRATFSPQTCNPNSAVLGSAGPISAAANFPAAPRADTFYYSALANSLIGTDQRPGFEDINTTFNSVLDEGTNCLGGQSWDYRINPPNPTALTVASTVLHELAHGLGFSTLTNSTNGSRPDNFDDQFSLFLRDLNLNQTWPEMTDSDRAGSATSNGALVWDGPRANAQSSFLTEGLNNGQPRMFAPVNLQLGSSVSHWDVTLEPNELMEPSSTVPQENWLTLQAMYDMGWRGNPCIKSDVPNGAWVMFSLDCQPPAGENTLEDILGDDIEGVYGTSWIVYEYDPLNSPSGTYVTLGLTDVLETGKGYWFAQVDNETTVVDAPDTSSRTPSPIVCALGTGQTCVEIPLRTVANGQGFTIVGNPFRRDIPIDTMRIVTDTGACSAGCTFEEADTNGVTYPLLYAFNSATGAYDPLASGAVLTARSGAWAATKPGASEGLSPRLQMPR